MVESQVAGCFPIAAYGTDMALQYTISPLGVDYTGTNDACAESCVEAGYPVSLTQAFGYTTESDSWLNCWCSTLLPFAQQVGDTNCTSYCFPYLFEDPTRLDIGAPALTVSNIF